MKSAIISIAERGIQFGQYFDGRKQRAKEIADGIPAAELYVALRDVKLDRDLLLLDGVACLRKVQQAPGLVEITSTAIRTRDDYLAVSRHMQYVTAELIVNPPDWKTQSILTSARTFVTLLKLRGHEHILAPFCSSVSSDSIPAAHNQSVHFRLLDDYTARLLLSGSPDTITEDDAQWTGRNFISALSLSNPSASARFRLAFELYHGWNHNADYRVAMATIWSALEALFGKRDDRRVTEALCGRVADWLNGTSTSNVRRLYNRRCDVVHGRPLLYSDIADDLSQSANLLQRSLTQAIETKTSTLPDWS
jgi:hypothetical protein